MAGEMDARIGPLGLTAVFISRLLLMSCDSYAVVNKPQAQVLPTYTKEVCSGDLEGRINNFLSEEKSIDFHDDGINYRALDVKVDFYAGPDSGKDLTISIRNIPLAYWGFNSITKKQISGLPRHARKMMDKEPFRPVADIKCPSASSFWDKEDEGGVKGDQTPRIQLLFNNLLMSWVMSGASPIQMDFMHEFGAVFDPMLNALDAKLVKVAGFNITCIEDYFEFFTDENFRKLRVAIAINCKLHNKTPIGQFDAFTALNSEMNKGRYLAVFEETLELKPVPPGDAPEKAAQNLKMEMKYRAALLAQKAFEFVKERFSSMRSI